MQGDNLDNYTGELRTTYENLSAEVLQALQPATNLPESKVDADFFKAKEAECIKKGEELEKQNQNDRYDLDNYNPEVIRSRIKWAIIITAVISLGEALFNTKALQVIGDSLLFALIMSICVSFVIFIFSHAFPMIYKEMNTVWKRRLVIISSLLLVTGMFTALAIFRSTFLAANDIHIKPIYFIAINLFFFIVSALVSFFLLPTRLEIRDHHAKTKIYDRIKKRKKEIETLEQVKRDIKEEVKRVTKDRIRILYLSKYVINRIEKMYYESVATFKGTNLNYRTDHQSPDCFREQVPVMTIDEQAFSLLNPERK